MPERGRNYFLEALKDSFFTGYDSEISGASIDLLRDSGNLSIGSLHYLKTRLPESSFDRHVLTAKLIVESLDSYYNLDSLSQLMLDLAELGLLMRRDNTANLKQHLYATAIFDIAHDILGDISLLQKDAILERASSHSRAIGELWGEFWQKVTISRNSDPFLFRTKPSFTLLFALLLMLPFAGFFSILLIPIVLLQGFNTQETKESPLIWTLWGFGLLIAVGILSGLVNRIPAYIISVIPLFLGIDTFITCIREKREGFVLSTYLLLLSLFALAVTAWAYYPIALAIPPLAIFFSVHSEAEKHKNPKGLVVSRLFVHFQRLFILIAFLALVLIAPKHRELEELYQTTSFNAGFQATGSSLWQPQDPFDRFGDHFPGKADKRSSQLRELNLLYTPD